MAKLTEKELELQYLEKKTLKQQVWDYLVITVASLTAEHRLYTALASVVAMQGLRSCGS